MPERVQRLRRRGWRMPANTVYVGRPTFYGNPYVVGEPGAFGRPMTLARTLIDFEFLWRQTAFRTAFVPKLEGLLYT